MDIDISRCRKIPLREIVIPKHGITPVTDKWWVITNDDCVILYGNKETPQFNSDREVLRCSHPNMKSVFIPIAFIPS